MCSSFLENVIQVEGNPRQISEVFQQGKQREKDSHGRKHDCHHPGGSQISAVQQYTVNPPGDAKSSKDAFQKRVDGINQERIKQT